MSTKKRKPNSNNIKWQATVAACRTGIAQTLRDIEGGELDMADFEKLNNWCQFALTLMETAGPVAWEQARHKAEWAAYSQEIQHGHQLNHVPAIQDPEP